MVAYRGNFLGKSLIMVQLKEMDGGIPVLFVGTEDAAVAGPSCQLLNSGRRIKRVAIASSGDHGRHSPDAWPPGDGD